MPESAEARAPPSLSLDLAGSAHAGLLQVNGLIAEAARCRSLVNRLGARKGHLERLDLLRRGDLQSWARCLRPSAAPSESYMPDCFVNATGDRQPPQTVQETLTGAEQAWLPLLQEPTSAWSHESVVEWQDAIGRRGAPHFLSAHETFRVRPSSKRISATVHGAYAGTGSEKS